MELFNLSLVSSLHTIQTTVILCLILIYRPITALVNDDVIHGPITSVDDVTTVLIIIDVQNCFIPGGGTLPVPNGQDVIPVINDIRQKHNVSFDFVVTTNDWHCSDHVSFASQHSGHEDYSLVNLTYIQATGELCAEESTTNNKYAVNCSMIGGEQVTLQQVMWPDHCIMSTVDSQLHKDLLIAPSDLIILKGNHCQIDSYSAFFDNGHMSATTLDSMLRDRHVTDVYLVGLATDFCVFYSAVDAHELGYRTSVIVDATRGISEDSTTEAIKTMKSRGIKVINSSDLDSIFTSSSSRQVINHPALTAVKLLVILLLSK